MGFDQQQAQQALMQNSNNQERALDWLLSNQGQQSSQTQQNDYGNQQRSPAQGAMPSQQQNMQQSQDDQLQRALQASMQSNNSANNQPIQITGDDDRQLQEALEASMKPGQSYQYDQTYEPLAPNQRLRDDDLPCGLRNIGNTCYFNSLLQVYYNMPKFVQAIMQFQVDDQQSAAAGEVKDSLEQKKIQSGMNLIKQLKELFGLMTKGNKKYADPHKVLRSIVDNFGESIKIGDEKDIREFNEVFHSRIQDAFNARMQQEKQAMQAQMQNNTNANSDVPMTSEANGSQTRNENSSFHKNQTQDEESKDNAMEVDNAPPLMKQKSKINQDIDMIQSMFSGKLKTLISYNDSKGETNYKEVQDIFSDVLLNVTVLKDVYEAWEQDYQDTVEEFEYVEGSRTTAQKVDWVETLPQILAIQMNRLTYQNNTAKKVLHKVPIQKEIYPDRFLYKNRTEVETLRLKVKSLRDNIRHLEECLTNYKNFEGSGYDITKVLGLSMDFFSKQGEKTTTQGDYELLPGVQERYPLHQDKLNPVAIKPMIALLKEQMKQTQAQQEDLENQIKQLQDQVKLSYQNLNRSPYYLHSICVHDGNAESGHYYTFIYDRFQKKWRKYNDIHVTDVTEEQVFEESNGSHGNMSAYWVVYIDDKQSQTLEQTNLNSYSAARGKNQGATQQTQESLKKRSDYEHIMPDDISRMVMIKNQEILNEIESQKAEEICKKVMQKYDERMSELSKFYSNGKKAPNYMKDVSIYTCLMSQHEGNLCKQVLLDQCYFEIQKERMFTSASELFIKKLQEQCKGRENYPYPTVVLQDQGIAKMKQIEPKFKQTHVDQQILSMVFEEIHNKDLLTTICLIHTNIKRLGPEFQNIKPNMMKDSLRICCLRICFVINQLIVQASQTQDKDERQQITTKIIDNLLGVEFGVDLLEKTDRHRVVVALLLEETFKLTENFLKDLQIQQEFDQITQSIKSLNNVIEVNGLGKPQTVKLDKKEVINKLEELLNQREDWLFWVPLEDENVLHQRLTRCIDSFKKENTLWLSLHLQVMKKDSVINPQKVFAEEKSKFNVDVTDIYKLNQTDTPKPGE